MRGAEPQVDSLRLDLLFGEDFPLLEGVTPGVEAHEPLGVRRLVPPARGTVERMRAGPESQIRHARPVRQVVSRPGSGARVVRNLVVLVPRSGEGVVRVEKFLLESILRGLMRLAATLPAGERGPWLHREAVQRQVPGLERDG